MANRKDEINMRMICYLFPTFASMNRKDMERPLLEFISKYCINNIIVNILVLTCVSYANKFEYKNLSEEVFCVNFSIKYLILGVFFAILLRIIEKTINITFITEKKNNDKKSRN